jgi:serine/threonine protein kinase
MIPIYEAINRIRVNIPAFKMIELDQKQFILMKETSIFKDYDLIKEIGKGSFGSVYKARERKTN